VVKQNPLIVSVLRIVLPYLVLGAAWILFSDRLILAITGDTRALMILSIAKGWLYVLVTGGLLFVLIYGELRGRAILEARLRDGLAEKGALLAELNHRVKNNLQVIASILNLETEKIEGAEARALNDRTSARIRAMEIAHERLFETGEIAHIELGGYVRALWDVLADILATKKSHPSFELEMSSQERTRPFPSVCSLRKRSPMPSYTARGPTVRARSR